MTQIDSMLPNGSFLEVHCKGVCEGADFLTYMPQVRAAFSYYRLNQVLLDFSDVSCTARVTAEHAFAEYLAQELPKNVRLSIVEPRSLDLGMTHFETAARNRGVCVRVFQDLSKAAEWLGPYEGS